MDAVESESTFNPFKTSDLDTSTSTFDGAINDKNVIKYIDGHINDESFAQSMVDQFDDILNNFLTT